MARAAIGGIVIPPFCQHQQSAITGSHLPATTISTPPAHTRGCFRKSSERSKDEALANRVKVPWVMKGARKHARGTDRR